MRILLKGYYGFGNLGDDILMKVSHAILKRKYANAAISIYSENTPNNPHLSDPVGFNQYIHSLLEDTPRLVDWTCQDDYDLLFDGGGGIYKDHTYGNWGHVIVNKITRYTSPQRLWSLENRVRKNVKKPYQVRFSRRIGFGLSIGPFRKSAPSYIRKIAEIGSYDELFVRDEASIRFLEEVKFKNNFYKVTDIAFLVDNWLPEEIELQKDKHPSKIGVILLDWYEDNDKYLRNIKEATTHLENEGYEISFFSFQKNQDTAYISYFENRVIAWNPYEYSLKQFLSIIQQQHLLITSRAHGAIIGACLGVPSICLGITLKLEEISKMLRRSSTLILPPFLASHIIKAVQDVFANYQQCLDHLKHDLDSNKKEAQIATEKLFNIL